jgi:hypothetical protein
VHFGKHDEVFVVRFDASKPMLDLHRPTHRWCDEVFVGAFARVRGCLGSGLGRSTVRADLR